VDGGRLKSATTKRRLDRPPCLVRSERTDGLAVGLFWKVGTEGVVLVEFAKRFMDMDPHRRPPLLDWDGLEAGMRDSGVLHPNLHRLCHIRLGDLRDIVEPQRIIHSSMPISLR
jgi:hypothetical protein